MRRLCVTLLVVIPALLVGASSHPASSLAPTSPMFRVATFNIHKGADTPGHYDLEQTIETIRRLDADLVGAQEVMQNDAGLNCDDQPALIAAGLRRRTGRPWTHVYLKAWVGEDKRCLQRGRGDNANTEGVAVFTPERCGRFDFRAPVRRAGGVGRTPRLDASDAHRRDPSRGEPAEPARPRT